MTTVTVPVYRPAGGLLIAVYGFLCDYGRSYLRPLLLLGLTIIFGAVPLWPPFGLEFAIGLSFANTFSVLGIRRDFMDAGTLKSLSAALQVCATLQTLLGIVLLFLFSLGLRNRLRMK